MGGTDFRTPGLPPALPATPYFRGICLCPSDTRGCTPRPPSCHPVSGAGLVGPEPLAVPRRGHLEAKGESPLPDTPCRNGAGGPKRRDGVPTAAGPAMAGRHSSQPPLPALGARSASSFKYAVVPPPGRCIL